MYQNFGNQAHNEANAKTQLQVRVHIQYPQIWWSTWAVDLILPNSYDISLQNTPDMNHMSFLAS